MLVVSPSPLSLSPRPTPPTLDNKFMRLVYLVIEAIKDFFYALGFIRQPAKPLTTPTVLGIPPRSPSPSPSPSPPLPPSPPSTSLLLPLPQQPLSEPTSHEPQQPLSEPTSHDTAAAAAAAAEPPLGATVMGESVIIDLTAPLFRSAMFRSAMSSSAVSYVERGEVRELELQRLEEFKRESHFADNQPSVLWGYLDKLFRQPTLSAKTLIEFSPEGDVRFAASNPNACKQFRYMLARTYGVCFADRMTLEYGLDKSSALTFDMMANILMKVAAQVTKSDLMAVYEDMRSETSYILCHGYMIPAAMKDSILETPFEELSSEQLSALLQPFRVVPVNSQLCPVQTVTSIGAITQQHPDRPFLEMCASMVNPEEHSCPEATLELLAKKAGYNVSAPGQIIPYIKPSGQGGVWVVNATLDEKNDGMTAHILTDLCPTTERRLILNFRGTQPTTSASSVRRDMDAVGVGKSTFEQRLKDLEVMICRQLNDAQETNGIILDINGHSLGAADAARMMAALATRFADPSHDPVWDKITAINVSLHNPPGLEAALNVQFKEDLRRFSSTAPRINATIFRFEGDPVQTCGAIWLGLDIDLPHFDVRVLNLASTTGVTFLRAHSAFGFGLERNNFDLREIKKADNWHILQQMLGGSSSDTILGIIAGVAVSALGRVAREVAHPIAGLVISAYQVVRGSYISS